jgi:DNA-binding response OmpR family regulator
MVPGEKPPSILVVDDDSVFRYAAFRALQSAGFTVITTADYFDALSVLDDKAAAIDVLLVSLLLPTGNGFALARMARDRRLGLRCIHTQSGDRREMRIQDTEAVGPVLDKPISAERLVAEVHSALRHEQISAKSRLGALRRSNL